MDLRRQLSIVRSWILLIVLAIVLAAGASYLVSIRLPKVYEANASLIVGQSLTAVNPDYNQLLASQRLSQTYATVVTTRPLLQRVVDALKLSISPDALASEVTANAPANNTLITITVADNDPTRAANIANAISNELIAVSPAIQGQQSSVQQFVTEDLASTQTQIESAQTEADRLSALPTRSDQDNQNLQDLETRLVSLRSAYASLLGYASNSSSNLLTVIEPAIPPIDPASPRVLLNTLLAAFVGLLLALGIAYLAEYLDDTIKSADDVTEVVELPTLGAISRIRSEKGRNEIYRMVTLLYPRSPITEAFRTLRTNAEFASVDRPLHTLLVTSTVQGEGKTTMAANLAVVFAQEGKRVLLLDADLRKPGVHRMFDLPNALGLTTLILSDETSLDSVTQETEQDHLRVLTTGPLPPNPAELLGSQRFAALLGRLSAAFDLIVIDSPPIQAVTDAAILSAMVDGTIFVIDSGKTRRGLVRHGREALAKAGARVLGVSLNRLSPKAKGEYYYSQYGYGKAYGESSKSKSKMNPAAEPATAKKA